MTLVTRRHPPVWAFVSAAWLGPAVPAALKEYAQGVIGNGVPPTWRVLLWEAGDCLIYFPGPATAPLMTAGRG
jgi:hypothetical protein